MLDYKTRPPICSLMSWPSTASLKDTPHAAESEKVTPFFSLVAAEPNDREDFNVRPQFTDPRPSYYSRAKTNAPFAGIRIRAV